MPGPLVPGPGHAPPVGPSPARRRARTPTAVAFGLLTLIRTTTADPPAGDAPIARPDAPTAPDARPSDEVEDAPGWLPSHQAPDGRWPAETFDRFVRGRPAAFEDVESRGLTRNDVLTTAFAVSVLAAAGYSPTSSGPMGATVAAGAHALRSMQREDGSFADPRAALGATNHAVAVFVLATLVDAWGDPRDGSALDRAVAFYLASRAAGVPSWREELGPSAVTPIGWIAAARGVSWVAHRRASARSSPLHDDPVDVADPRARRPRLHDDPRLARDQTEVGTWLKASEGTWTHGRAGLALWLHAITASGPGWKTSTDVRAAVTWLDAHPPRWDGSGAGVDAAGWYLATLGAFRVGGAAWDHWQKAIKTAVVDTQRKDGTYCTTKGSWDPVGDFADEGGRVFATAMMASILVIWYHYDQELGRSDDHRTPTRGVARDRPRRPVEPPPPRLPRMPPCE